MLRLRLLIAHPLLRSAVAYRLILSFSVLLFSSPAFSQSGLMHEIKSAYLFTLVEYFTWQNENNEDFQSPGNQFVIGIAGRDNDIYQSLVNGTRDRQIRNKSIAVRYMDDISNMGDAHLLFVTSPSPYRLADIATSTRRTNTLIVTDNHSDRIHFMINLLLTPDNTITFEVNKQNIVYEKIQMDNDVLLLGGTELDIAELLIATENEMLRSRSILEDTQSRLQTLQASVSNQETQLEQQAQTIAEREAIAEETARILEANRGLLDESDLALRSSQILLQDNSNELIETNTNLQVLRSELAARDSDKLEQARLIAENNELIGLQDSTILDQENRMRSQLAEMSQLDLAVRNYQSWNQIILALLAGLVALTLIVLYVSRQKMRVNKLLASQNVELQQAKMDLQFASDRADAASKAKGRFLANMSHEIRTPMTAILGYSELLQGYGNGEKKQKKYLHAINKNSEHLLMLINEVLDISKIESGKVELHTEVFDLRAMLADINSMFRVQTNAKGLQLKFDIEADTPKYVEADAGKMKQIVINLVGNAVKFTRTGSVSIKIGSGESMQ